MANWADQIELDGASSTVSVEGERRRRIEEPPPVRLVAIDDFMIWAAAGLERQLDEFYQGLVGFERVESQDELGFQEIVYRAENFRLRIEVLERPGKREDFRPVMVEVPSLNLLGQRLAEAGVEFARQKGLTPGTDALLVSDPAGNPVVVGEFRIAI